MDITNKTYAELVRRASPPSKKVRDLFGAVTVGGMICVIGQLLTDGYTALGMDEKVVKMAVPVTLVFLSVLLTGLKIYERIAKFAGAGTLVPITGFANAVSSPAIEFKNEGFVLGVGANMFKIAGPVIAYGTVASVVYGVIYWFTTLF